MLRKKLSLFALLWLSKAMLAQDVNDVQHERMLDEELNAISKSVNITVNENTQNYDVTYQKLEFTVNPSVYNIRGKVTVQFRALSNMASVVFDFFKRSDAPFTIASVRQNGASLSFQHTSGNELIIALRGTLLAGQTASVEINYEGAPSRNEEAFTVSTHGSNRAPVLYTLSQPYGARDWWPCKQDLNDKIDSLDVYITAPSQYVSVANGVLQKATVSGSNKTTHFKHRYPIPAYLVAIAVSNYTVFNQQAGLGTATSPFFPIVNYLYPESETTARSGLAVTPRIMNLFESLVGPYPYRKEQYGHAQFGFGGGMEHTTMSFMGGWSRFLIAHELAHQWFGNRVTCGSWKDIWLNEGITEFMAGAVVESFDGNSAFTSWKANKINSITSRAGGNLYLTDAQIASSGSIFSSRITYNKGAMVTNMLRWVLGTDVFYRTLRDYLNDPRFSYGYAVTPAFESFVKEKTGVDVSEFFNDWVYNQGYPTYTIRVSNSGSGRVAIRINQTQSHPSVSFFEMPIQVRLLGSGGRQKDVVLNNTSNGQLFEVDVPFSVISVQFDPNRNIISKGSVASVVSSARINEGLIVQAQVYPSPATDVVKIQLPANVLVGKATVFNNTGQKVLEIINQTTINVSKLASGIYNLLYETNKGERFQGKFVKN